MSDSPIFATCVTPRYLPNIRHLARLAAVDTAVVLDMAAMPDRNSDSFVNRNRIRNVRAESDQWLTAPILRVRGQPIGQVQVNETDHRWVDRHLNAVHHAYPRHDEAAPGFMDGIADLLRRQDRLLLSLNLCVTMHLLQMLGSPPVELAFESALVSAHRKSHRYDVMVELGAAVYLSGEVEHAKIGPAEWPAATTLAMVAAPQADVAAFALTVRYSVIHCVLTEGLERAHSLFIELVKLERRALEAAI